eukprot:Gb_14409 [translate_table: standard]
MIPTLLESSTAIDDWLSVACIECSVDSYYNVQQQQQQSYHAYGAYSQDPSYGHYPGYDYSYHGYYNYYQQPMPQVQEITTANTYVQPEEADDSLLAPPDVDKLNAEYIVVHLPALLG